MKRVKIFSDFCDSQSCKKNFETIGGFENVSNYGIDKNVYITSDDDYTHAIIINKAMPTLTIPKDNVIGFAFERVFDSNFVLFGISIFNKLPVKSVDTKLLGFIFGIILFSFLAFELNCLSILFYISFYFNIIIIIQIKFKIRFYKFNQ